MSKVHNLSIAFLFLAIGCNTEKRVELDFTQPDLNDSTGVVLYQDELFEGIGFTKNDSGWVQTETQYRAGKKDGEHRSFGPTGELMFSAKYMENKKQGEWREYLNVETNTWEDYWTKGSTHYRQALYDNDEKTGVIKIFRSEDSTVFKVYQEGINSQGASFYMDTVYEYFPSGALSAVTYYPDSSNKETFLETYFENGNVEYRIRKHQNVPARYRRMLRELKQANREYNLDADFTGFTMEDSVVLKVVDYQRYNENGKRIENRKGAPQLEEAYSMLQDYLPLLQLQALTNLFGGSSSGLFGSSSSSNSFGSSSNSSSSRSTSACHACNRTFNFKEWKGKAHGWSNFKESRPGYVKCGLCDGYGFTDEYHPMDYANPTTRKRCTNSRCQNGWQVCHNCHGKGSY